MCVVPFHHERIARFRRISRNAMSLAILWIVPRSNFAIGAELLYVALNDFTVVRYDVSLTNPTAVQNSMSVFIGAGVQDHKSLAFDSNGILHSASTVLGAVQRFDSAGQLIRPAPFASGLSNPEGMAFDATGNLYVATPNSNRIVRITPGGTSSVFATTNFPVGLAFDRAGNLYASSYPFNKITRITRDGTASNFVNLAVNSNPEGLAFDSAGNLYVANSSNGTITRVTPGRTTSTFASGLTGPSGLAFDSSGSLYVTSWNTSTITKFNSAGVLQFSWSTGSSLPRSLVFVPEPSTKVLAGLSTGLLALLPRRRRSVIRLGRKRYR